MLPSINHVALLVSSCAKAAAVCKKAGYELGPTEDFPSEGTREIYVGSSANARLLLMEPIGSGPYQNALEKRGPGLHHIAVDVSSIDDYVAGLAGSGWLLHPVSLHMLTHRRTVYLARPGLHTLIEVHEAKKSKNSDNSPFISEVHVTGEPRHQRLLDALGVQGLKLADKDSASIVIAGKRIEVKDLAFG